jgi:hypothetical protein
MQHSPCKGSAKRELVAELCKEAYNGRKATIKEGLADVPLEPAVAGIGSGSLQGDIRLPQQRGGVHRTLRVAGNAVVAPEHV